ncbi:inosine-5-monophosphate dehydrogenase [Phyllobacterium phragmitis]|uniref:Inosine-5-monophosphate dehydrogenase n=1 Tax=Phyllobacterium phragmitis TaxID=2670329 RepID=A0A2S9INC9_9HYPH|nr:CBS domain-containing protein [Phyllobacterium phragmitis]PRD41992.1 inosine-5-monophosphate dehydrogenase [Phyllobacterium phragmitis]
MTVRSILERKGHDVVSVTPDASIIEAVAILAMHRIGALVICDGEKAVKGILSERDVVRAIAEQGLQALDRKVSELMTSKVHVCHEHNTVNEVMEIMTVNRFRHLPVERDGLLYGIISIGDVVKRRIEEVEREAEDIKAYIATA